MLISVFRKIADCIFAEIVLITTNEIGPIAQLVRAPDS